MSQHSIGSGPAEPADPAPLDEELPADNSQRNLRLLLAGAAGLAVLALLMFLVVLPKLHHSSTPSAGPVATPTVHASSSPAPSHPGKAAHHATRRSTHHSRVVPAAFTGSVGRNPFLALVAAPTGGSGSSSSSSSSSGSSGKSGTSGSKPSSPSKPPAGSSPAPTPGSETLYLSALHGTTAYVTVNGAAYHVRQGHLFGHGFKLLGVHNHQATFQYEDVIFSMPVNSYRIFA